MVSVSRAIRIALSGEYDIANAGEVSVLLQAAEYATEVTIDCRDLTYMDSSGMTALFRLQQTVEWAGGTVTLVGMKPHIRRLFAITRLESLFTFVD